MGIPSLNELSGPVVTALRQGPILLALVAAVLASQACGSAAAHHLLVPGPVIRVATHPNSGVSEAALVKGTLVGTINGDGTACFYVENGANRYALIWPEGVSARADPLRVIRTVNGEELTFATVGEHVAIGGGATVPPPISVLGCGRPPQSWIVAF